MILLLDPSEKPSKGMHLLMSGLVVDGHDSISATSHKLERVLEYIQISIIEKNGVYALESFSALIACLLIQSKNGWSITHCSDWQHDELESLPVRNVTLLLGINWHTKLHISQLYERTERIDRIHLLQNEVKRLLSFLEYKLRREFNNAHASYDLA
ncbi:hypothetical protein BCV71DRAFT_230858 [Rhizopus microsporus]|uniref:Uncharacterized protein n=1 Tax=Rhizopus microsporus TaxID=58291 RepID=A0A1X0SFC4_RHIZD|nr:hypothetical protein BCV71DRAFT_230858 [Rhizopus microsporus]